MLPADERFIQAVRGNDVVEVKFLLDSGQDIEAGQDINTPLCIAIEYEHVQMIEQLVQNKADLGMPLFVAVKKDWLEIVEYLFENKASHAYTNQRGQQPLAAAANAGNIDIIKFLIEKGASTSHLDTARNTLVHHAISDSHAHCLDVVKLFIKSDHDISKANVQNQAGRTPFHTAVSNSNETVVKFFIRHGVNGRIRDTLGYTPLLLSLRVLYGVNNLRCLEIVKSLIEQTDENTSLDGVATNIPCERGMSPLGWVVSHAIASRDMAIGLIRLLLAFGADPSAVYPNRIDSIPASKQIPPLIRAFYTFEPKFATLLLINGADVNGRDEWGGTILHTYLRMLYLKSLEATHQVHFPGILISLKVDIEATDAMGHTALHYAALLNMPFQVLFLLRAGACMYAKNRDGMIPRQCSFSGGIHDVFDEEVFRRETLDLAFLTGCRKRGGSLLQRCDPEVLRMILENIHDMPPVNREEAHIDTPRQEQYVEKSLHYITTPPVA